VSEQPWQCSSDSGGLPAGTNPPRRPTVVVVAAVIVDDEGRVLLTRRDGEQRFAGYWEFPGGKIEWGEHPRAALIRELDEELGVRPDHVGDVLEVIAYTMKDIHWIVLFFYVRLSDTQRFRKGLKIKRVKPEDLAGVEILPPNRTALPTIMEKLLKT